MNNHLMITLLNVLYIKPHTVRKFRVSFDARAIDQYLPSFPLNSNYGKMFNRIKYLIIQKRNISDVCYDNYMRMKISLNNDIPLEIH